MYNSPLFHITSNIDEHSQQLIQQNNTHTRARERTIIPYITVFLPFRLIQHYWRAREEEAVDDEAAAHYTPPIQSHYFSFSNTHTHTGAIISHHHRRWKTEKKSQDARMPGDECCCSGVREFLFFSAGKGGESWFAGYVRA